MALAKRKKVKWKAEPRLSPTPPLGKMGENCGEWSSGK